MAGGLRADQRDESEFKIQQIVERLYIDLNHDFDIVFGSEPPEYAKDGLGNFIIRSDGTKKLLNPETCYKQLYYEVYDPETGRSSVTGEPVSTRLLRNILNKIDDTILNSLRAFVCGNVVKVSKEFGPVRYADLFNIRNETDIAYGGVVTVKAMLDMLVDCFPVQLHRFNQYIDKIDDVLLPKSANWKNFKSSGRSSKKEKKLPNIPTEVFMQLYQDYNEFLKLKYSGKNRMNNTNYFVNNWTNSVKS